MYNTTFEPFIIDIYSQEALYKDTYNQLNTESFVWLMLKTMPLTTRASRQTLQDPA
jgi:dipeptidase